MIKNQNVQIINFKLRVNDITIKIVTNWISSMSSKIVFLKRLSSSTQVGILISISPYIIVKTRNNFSYFIGYKTTSIVNHVVTNWKC